MTKFVGLRAKTYSYLQMSVVKIKKEKTQKTVSLIANLNLKIIKIVSKQLNLRIKQTIQKTKEIDTDSPKKDEKEFIKNNRLILKTQKRFKNERHNIFTQEINKIALSLNDDKRLQSSYLKETYANAMSKDLVSEKKRLNVAI